MRCGIDFGTSNTTMAVSYPDGARLIPLENQSLTIPTAIFFPDRKDGDILFGRAAQQAYLEGHEGRLLRSLKRIFGTALMEQTTMLRGQRWQFPAVVGKFLSHIKQQGETHLQAELTDLTLGRPVHFQDGDKGADARAESELRAIATNVGFKNIKFQFEPIAAALAHEKNAVGEQLALVIDIGGGTSDFSVIRLSRDYKPDRNRAQDILANTGVRVGGNDCDRTINLDAMMPLLGLGSHYGEKGLEMPVRLYHELSEWVKVNWCYTPQNEQFVADTQRASTAPDKLARLYNVLQYHLGHRILDASESVKIALSEKDKAEAALDFIEKDLSAGMTQVRMNKLFTKTLDPVQKMMLETLRHAGLKPQDIALVILTGGSTALPIFQSWITRYFPHAQVLQEDKLGSVGLGLVL
jgi:hypothetical chaperone protein